MQATIAIDEDNQRSIWTQLEISQPFVESFAEKTMLSDESSYAACTSHHWYLHDLSFDHIVDFEEVSITGQDHLIAIAREMGSIQRVSIEKQRLDTFILLAIHLIQIQVLTTPSGE
jgi:hypothetical protein